MHLSGRGWNEQSRDSGTPSCSDFSGVAAAPAAAGPGGLPPSRARRWRRTPGRGGMDGPGAPWSAPLAPWWLAAAAGALGSVSFRRRTWRRERRESRRRIPRAFSRGRLLGGDWRRGRRCGACPPGPSLRAPSLSRSGLARGQPASRRPGERACTRGPG